MKFNLSRWLPESRHRRSILIFSVALAFAALAAGMSDQLMSNYFKDAYLVTTFQRGLIEFPRELPGILVIFVVSLLASFGSMRLAMLAQGLAIFGLVVLGFLTPPFAVMLVFLFIYSLGGHIWYPLQDSIAMRLIHDENNAGRTIGRFKGVSTAFTMVASIGVFLGFRYKLFSFTTPVKTIFLLAACMLLVVMAALVLLRRTLKPVSSESARPGQPAAEPTVPVRKFRFVFRREYKYYYILAIVFGVQKQIMFVYGPWVLIELLGKKADTISLLGVIGAFIGIFFIPALGRWLDRFGIKKMLYIDAFSFIGVYIAYGLLSSGFSSGLLPKAGLPVILAGALFVVDRMSMQMGLIRSLYMRSIALKTEDIAPTLTLGQSMDHVVSIVFATLGGVIWSAWGPQYIFFMAAGFSMLNFMVAVKAKINDPKAAVHE